MAGNRNSRPVVGRWRQVLHGPARRFLRVPGDVEQGGRLAWCQRHVELVQREGETVTFRFDVGFLAGPASKKSRALERYGQGPQYYHLAR